MRVITDLTPTAENQEIIYNSFDTLQTQALYEKFERDFPDWAKETARYSELMLGPVLTMMRRGVKIDVERRDRLVAGLEGRKQKVAATFDYLCSELFGTTVNWNSTPQLKVLFYSFLGIPEQTKSKKGEVKVATDREILERIAASYASGAVFANLILRIRDLEKQIEFLTKKLSEDNRFHASFNVAGTDTFRLSSSEHPFRMGCVPEDAEALTENGWVPIKERPARIMQWSEGGSLDFVDASWNFYEVDAVLPAYSGRCVRGVFTPEHRVPFLSTRDKLKTVTAAQAAGISCFSTPVTGLYLPGISVDENWIRKLVMLSADGNEYAPGKWRLKFKKERKSLRCASVLGVPPKARASYGYFDYSGINIEGVTKKFPDITKWDLFSRQVFFDELRHWDAHVRGSSYMYYTTIPENANLVLTAAHMTGLSASIHVSEDNSNKYGNTSTKPLYIVNVSPKTVNKLESKRWQAEHYKGVVGCPTVPSGFWLIKYRGGVYVTGNSNLQNIPKEARTCFVADPGYVLFYSDQQGAEARIVAYLSGDENYIAAVEGGDSHTMVASMVFGFPPDRELAEREYYRGYSYRDITKKGAHGSNYYGKPFTLAQQMKVETSVAEQFQAQYFKRFPGITEWHGWVARQLQEVGHLTTPFGIRRTFWGRRWDDATLRTAIAFVPQHCVGVLMNIGIYRLWHRFEGKGDVQILLNLHDAVLGQVRADKVDELLPEVLECLRFPFGVRDINGKEREVLIPFDVEIGDNWGKHGPSNPGGLQKWRPQRDGSKP